MASEHSSVFNQRIINLGGEIQALEPDAQPSTQPAESRRAAWRNVFVLVGGGVIINWLSNIWAPATPVVIVLALLSFPLLAMSDGSRLEQTPALAWIASLKRDGLIELCLAALVLGFAIASISLIPVWPTVKLGAPSPGSTFGFGGSLATTNYEVGTVTVVVLMVTVAAYRAPSLLRQTSFLVCALYGVAFAYTYLRPEENAFLPTFVGGFMIAAAMSALLAALPRMFLVLRSFWGFGKQAVSHPPAESLPNDNTARFDSEAPN